MSISVKTEHPGAFDSLDHLYPIGSVLDNFSSLELISEVSDYFGTNNQISVLDLGCAGGKFICDFIQQGDIGVGLEGSSTAIDGAGKVNWKKYYNKNLFLCDIGKPFEILHNNNSLKFDFIHSEEVFEHIPEENIDCLLQNIKNHTKENTICMFGISIVTSIHTQPDGTKVDLHVTNKPAEWWMEKFDTNGFKLCENGITQNNVYGFIFKSVVRPCQDTIYFCLENKN